MKERFDATPQRRRQRDCASLLEDHLLSKFHCLQKNLFNHAFGTRKRHADFKQLYLPVVLMLQEDHFYYLI